LTIGAIGTLEDHQAVAGALAGRGGLGQPQPQAPPQQPPPADGPEAAPRLPATPPTATVDSSFTVSSCPCGHVLGADDSLIGLLSSKVSPHARHRYSYRGTPPSYAPFTI
jgi:hypothetical protein